MRKTSEMGGKEKVSDAFWEKLLPANLRRSGEHERESEEKVNLLINPA